MTTTSISGHVTVEARDKLRAYQLAHEFKNVSDALEHLIKHTKVPEVVKVMEPDPDQTSLSRYEL